MDIQKVLGVWWSFLSAFLWATVYVSIRWLMRDGKMEMDPVTLSLLRFALGGAVLWGICYWKLGRKMFDFSLREFGKIALLSQFSFVGMSIFLFWGQAYTTAINSSMIMSGAPVLIMLLGLFIGEKISWLQGLGMAVGTLGCMMVIEVITQNGIGYSANSISGDLLVLVSALSWAVSAILAKKIVTPGNDLAVTAWSLVFAAFSLLVIDACRWQSVVFPQTTAAWVLVVYLALFPTALGFYAWNCALGRISLTVVNIMQYLTPILTILMANLFLGEEVGGWKMAGILLVLTGVIAASVKKSTKRQSGNEKSGNK